MNGVVLALHQARYGLLVIARNPRVLVFTVIFPVVLLVLLASIVSGATATTEVHGVRVSIEAYFTAGILAYALMMNAFSTIAISLTTQRESGLLKRFRGTPVPAWTFIAAQVVRSIALVSAMAVVLLAIGHFAYGVEIPAVGLLQLLLFVALGTFAFCALGVALTAVTSTPDSASAIAPFATVLLAFTSGVFVQADLLPHALVTVGAIFPLAHLAQGMQSALGADGTTHLAGGDVAALVAWGAAGIAVAIRTFSWQPRAAPA